MEVGEKHIVAAEKAKRIVNSPLLLTLYKPDWKKILAANASNAGISGIISA